MAFVTVTLGLTILNGKIAVLCERLCDILIPYDNLSLTLIIGREYAIPATEYRYQRAPGPVV